MYLVTMSNSSMCIRTTARTENEKHHPNAFFFSR